MSNAVHLTLEHYSSENKETLANLERILMTGRLAGTGKLVILPVDQGFEHGPARSFAMNPAAYDPDYHVNLAIEAGCSAYAAPYGFIQHVASRYAKKMPLILKLNNHDSIVKEDDPIPALTSSVEDAARMGCVGVGFTIYPGSKPWRDMYQQLQSVAAKAREHGLVLIVWCYPRGSGMSKEGQTGIDIIAYAAHLAAQMGAHIIKVKLPTDHIEDEKAKAVYESENVAIGTLAERVAHVVQSAFNGKRLIIFSGGSKKEDAEIYDEIRAIRDGGGHGSVIGRNSFQRDKEHAVEFLTTVMDIHAGKIQ
ncbi:MAG: class I fructose-bisphosphate aldolase [Patescibacteria group bacterium]|jgi:class I fructose-bisphosphate aldolase